MGKTILKLTIESKSDITKLSKNKQRGIVFNYYTISITKTPFSVTDQCRIFPETI